MRVKNIGILKEEQVKGENALETIGAWGSSCYCTDLARLNGVHFDSATGTCGYWVDAQHATVRKNKIITNNMNFMTRAGEISSTYKTDYVEGVRIAFSFDDVENFDINKLDELKLELPITIIGGRVGEVIDKLFNNKSKTVISTGRTHVLNHKKYPEYEVFGIRFIKYDSNNLSIVLSDGTVTKPDNSIYLRVESISLIVDEKARMIYSSNALFGSVFDFQGKEFKHSFLNRDLNGDFLKSINDELEHSEPQLLFNGDEQQECNRYGFNYDKLTEEEIIEICINANIAVFLHGKTGVGKTERMVALDNDLELVDFGCTSSDGFTGIVAKDFNSKELFLYEPYWYKSLCQKCAAEPDKIHILFLEELTNAKSDIQKVAFEVTLNKTLTNSGFRLKLPANAVVCAAGNEVSESKSASPLSGPLFGRFAHVYIDTDSEAWLKWALKRKKDGKKLLYKVCEPHDTIHPAIVDFIRVNGNDALRTPYDGIKPNADPRKWALASKALYESNNPNVLRAFIGEKLTDDFIKFSKMNLVTVDDVINDRCHSEDIPFDPSLRWYTVVCLSTVDDDNFEKVRDFVSGLGNEFLAVFEYEWSKDNDERIFRLYNEHSNPMVKRLIPNGNK